MTANLFFVAEIDRAQLFLLAGFVMLGWVLARRTIRRRKTIVRAGREADSAVRKIQNPVQLSVPLCDAPPETQRWQVALFDLQRELKADLDTRIAVVQTLVRQADQRIAKLEQLQSGGGDVRELSSEVASRGDFDRLRRSVEKLRSEGKTCGQIASDLHRPLGEIELISSTIANS